LLAQSPFDGTWRANTDQSKLSTKPYVLSVNNGRYECSSCIPKIRVKADGTDQPVTGKFYDTLNVREVDLKTVTGTAKKGGMTISEQKHTISDDGNTLRPESRGEQATYELTFTRIGERPSGAHATSGGWQMAKFKESENAAAWTYKSSGDELSMSSLSGDSYTAMLNGKDYPVKGSYVYNSVSLRRINDHALEETDKRDGQIISVSRISVSPDGTKMTVVETDKPSGRINRLVYEKQ
jgi:hypothetical protein